METKCLIVAIGVFSLELLAYQITMVCAAIWSLDSSIYIHDVILG